MADVCGEVHPPSPHTLRVTIALASLLAAMSRFRRSRLVLSQ